MIGTNPKRLGGKPPSRLSPAVQKFSQRRTGTSVTADLPQSLSSVSDIRSRPSGKVVSGQVIIEGEPLPEGSLVTILSREADEPFHLDEGAEAELLESIAEAERGELIPAEEVLGSLRHQE